MYSVKGDTLYYSDCLRSLVQHPDITPIINDDWVIRYLNDWDEEEHETAYKNIFRLPPGHKLSFLNNTPKITSYWEMTNPSELDISREDACLQFKELLFKAVEKCLPKNTLLLASELSGGVDSSSITAIAYKLGADIRAFTHAAEDGNDERFLINDFLTMHPKVQHSLITKTGAKVGEEVRWATQQLGQPPRSGIAEYSKQLFEAAAKSGAKNILSGFGGDECVSQRATGCAYAEFIAKRQWGHLFREAKQFRPLAWPYTFLHMIYKYHFKSQPIFFNRSLDLSFLKEEYRLPPQEQCGMPRKSTFEYSKYLLPDRAHTSQRLEESYQIGASFGLKYHYPLLDSELIEFYNALPTYCKVYLNQNRYLFRNKAMADLMPQSIRFNYDKSIGGSTIPGVYDIRHTLQEEKLNEFSLKFLDQNYLQRVRKDPKLPFPTYYILACEELYKMQE